MLNGKVVVITGGAGLLGRSFVRSIVKHRGIAVIADLNAQAGSAFVEELRQEGLHEHVLSAEVDITSADSLVKMIDLVHARHGRIDALVNNAYPRNRNYGRRLEEVLYEDFCQNVSMHLGGYFLASQQLASYFKRQGRGAIVNMASIYGVIAPRFSVYEGTSMTMPVEYAAIKSGVIHLTKYMAQYFKGAGIRVNCISPGGILDGQPSGFLQRYNSHAATKGMLNPGDLQGALMFLLSEMSTCVNGQNLVVDDGWIL